METLTIKPQSPTTPEASVVESAPKGVVETTAGEQVEKPLEVSEYIKELWKVGEAENHFEMKTLLGEINDFVLSEIKRSGMKSDRKSYEEIIERYEDKLKLPEGVDIYTRVEKVNSLVKIDQKLLQAVKDKEELLAGDPTKMTSTQLKKYMELI